MTTTITGPRGIRLFGLLALKGALKLEILGMHRRGQSAYAQAKQITGAKGSKSQVLDALVAYIAAEYPPAPVLPCPGCNGDAADEYSGTEGVDWAICANCRDF